MCGWIGNGILAASPKRWTSNGNRWVIGPRFGPEMKELRPATERLADHLAICPCRRYLTVGTLVGTLTAKEVFYDTPHPCSAGAGDIHSSVVRPEHHPSHGSIWLYDRYRRQSHCEHVH